MTFEEFQKKKKEGSLINRNTQSQSSSNTKMSFDEFKAKKQNGTLLTQNQINTPQKTTTEKMDSLWVESTAPNVLEKKNINKDFSTLNIRDFVNNVKNSPETKKAQLTAEVTNLEKQIKSKEQEYNRANNYSDWNKKTQAKTEIGQELNALKEKLNTTKTSIAELNRGNEKLLTAEQVAENNKNAPLSQKIDKAIKYDIPKTAEKVGRTGMDLIGNVATGVTKGMEGYVDAGIGAGGTVLSGVANLAGKKELAENIKNKAEKIAGYGFAKDMQNLVNEKSQQGTGIYNPSILGAVDVRDAAQEIARMYAVAATGGLPGLMVSASGGNIEEALNEEQSLGRATAYGAISGSIEGLVEKLFDPAKIVGGGLKTFGNSFVGKVLEATAGEGAEEGISQALNPFVKILTYENGVENPFGSWENFKTYLKDIGQAIYQGAIIGGLTLGVSAPGNVDLQKSFSNDVYKAVEKIQGIDQVKKNEVINAMLEGAKSVTGQDIKNIRQYVENYRNNSQYMYQNANQTPNSSIQRENVTGLPKTDVQNQAQTQNIEQANATLPVRAEMAQNANMEQMAKNVENDTTKFSKQVDDLRKNNFNRQSELVVLQNTPQILLDLGLDNYPITIKPSKLETIYNDTAKRKKDHPHDLGELVKEIPEALKRPLNVVESVTRPGSIVVVTDLADKNGDIVVVSINPNDKGQLEIDDITTNKDVNKLTSAYGKREYDYIVNKETGEYEDGWMELNRINDKILYDIDEGIIKKRINGQWLQSPNVVKTLPNNSINQNDSSVNTQYAQNTQNDTSAYISPVSDIQGATEFVKKATIKDVETLQKMVEEAEKNPDRIDLQFFAEKAREAIDKLSRQQVREAIIEETGLGDYNLDDVNKISKAKMNFTTPVRVIEKIFNKETANKINEKFFKPIKHNEAERIRRLNKERADIKELDIKPGSAEDAAIQKFGEGEYIDKNGLTIPYTLENLKQDFPETWQKLKKATNVIRNKYDTYLEEINEVLKDNGYDPIPKRKDYFRHFEELNDLFSILGVPTKVDDIPTDLNGMTADLKPGKQFFANALQRKGNKTTYSAIKGIDGYLDGAMNMLYHTKDIQKLRTLEKYIRDTYGTQKGLDDANAMTDEQKNKRINQINEGHLSEFAAWLMEYTNALAGKKSRLDRGIEEMFGRKAYKYLNLIKKQVGANMTGLNVNSALSNFISVTQAAPKTSKKALVKGTVDTVKNIFNKDGFIDKSDFLTTRFGSDKIAKNWWQKAGDVGQIFMSGTDYFTANLITRSKYQEFLDKGYSDAEAMKKADEFADRLMAGRGKGDLPTAFESKMLGIVTQFQLEVTNQLDSIFYDTMHEDYASQSKSKLAKEHPDFYNTMSATFILGQIFALAFLYNEGKEELTGTEGGALDPIGTIADAIQYYTDENLSFTEATAKVVEDIANQLPFASIITGGGRLPIKEAFPDLLSVLKGESKLGDEAWKLANLLLPTGGGQLKKTTQGLSTFAKGGSYSKDAEGKEKLKYPVEQNLGNFVKSALFGKWSTEGAKRYIDSGFKALSANQTEGYEKAKKAGITDEQFYNAYNAQKKIKDLDKLTSLVKKNEIDKATKGLSTEKRKILYETFGVAKGEWDNTRIVLPYEIKAMKEKIAREKLKTEKK